MSGSRLVISLTALAVLLGGSIGVAALAFPLETQQETGEEAPVFVTGDVQKPVKIHEVAPQYTEEARKAGLQGSVILQAIIGKSGEVERVEVLKGLPMGLSEVSVDAVREWRFSPATLDGRPVRVYFNLTINFRLGDKKKEEG